ncbi:MAG: GIY-YIG nuclease family protein [Bacteroidetes bacterium]|nr:GIY-YIG nuclease family protein [Bacteroidota bacterium]
MEKKYAIVDLETTGGRAERDKITEIGIAIHNGTKIIDTYETLINPECYIPYGITQLTGITQDMVADAPKFYEVAKKIVEMTEGAIFVAHNVRFDYTFLREEFRRLGYTFTRKQLCTVRLSRQTFPGHRSYSLDNLINRLNIPVENRHRAMGDVKATVTLFERILAKERGEEELDHLVNMGVKEALLPQNITLEKLHALPDECGVYYLHNEKGDVVYVGKSINIRKRVMEHFADKTEKARKLQECVFEISNELTGSELVALLLESKEIKRLRPPVNRAQRRRYFPYAIHTYTNEAGYTCFEVVKSNAKIRKSLKIISEYPKPYNAKNHLEATMKNFELCARYCHLENGRGPCFGSHLGQCMGACTQKESPEDYNERALEAIEVLSTVFEKNFVVLDRGREINERSVVLVENGNYNGYGYVDLSENGAGIDFLKESIKYHPGNPETNRIIQRFLSKNKKVEVVYF